MIRKDVTKAIISCISAGVFAISIIGVNLTITGNVSAEEEECFIATDVPCVPAPEFQVKVGEILSVSITLPDNWASGRVGDFLRNDVVLSVYSNNAAGFTASMNTKGDTDLVNKYDDTYTIPTLSNNYSRENFPINSWGYALSNYVAASDSVSINETSAGTNSSTYKPLVDRDSAVTILHTTSPSTGSQDIYFGARADATKAAGIYSNTVVISVVTGIIDPDDNPAVPDPTTDNPATPSDDFAGDSEATYSSRDERTVYTRTDRSGSGSTATTTTTTEVTHGNTTSDYIASAGHAGPHGVTENVAFNLPEGTPLATGLIISAAIAGTTGIIILFAIRRKKDDDEDEEE